MPLVHNRYGKARVRMVKVERAGDRHELTEVSVTITLEGDFSAAYTAADNRHVLPTDTMKNVVYAVGREHPLRTVESYALDLAQHFVREVEPVSSARVTVVETPWEHLAVGRKVHGDAFRRPGGEKRTADARAEAHSAEVSAGISDLMILKTARSAFTEFLRDRWTTLEDADDRLLGTSLQARWEFENGVSDFDTIRQRVRDTLLEIFAEHRSASLQHTLNDMAEAVLSACPEVRRIHLEMPNRHCLLVDLSPFGLDNPNEIFLPIDEPHGVIEGTFERG